MMMMLPLNMVLYYSIVMMKTRIYYTIRIIIMSHHTYIYIQSFKGYRINYKIRQKSLFKNPALLNFKNIDFFMYLIKISDIFILLFIQNS
jgi:hypothetical protein